ncbi:MAG TPA: hypothetical protein VHA33_13735 [Candidatus Angelobacter sp.]|jgi:beta-lactamase superfamily II metal-dependent hydrolase|nr:hypothetical protein [Candidatus Angelobacter sp.]
MIFSLEALQAEQGDALILHYGEHEHPRFIVIDGGPAGVYQQSLRPRLQQLHDRWKRPDDLLDLEMIMVSHTDDDHIIGIADWIKEMEEDKAVPCRVRTCWYNSFESIAGHRANEMASLAPLGGQSHTSAVLPHQRQSEAVLASVANGRRLRERLDAQGIPLNLGVEELVMLPDRNEDLKPPERHGLTYRIIGPQEKRIKAFKKQWDEHVRQHPGPMVLAAFADQSVPNLSSIVVVVEFQGHRMLLTGDARGDDMLEGFAAHGLLDERGCAHFDVLKMPHHGSDRNVTPEWLQKITANAYVISANGRYSNPDGTTISWICQARGDAPYTLYFTNEKMIDPKDSTDVGAEIRRVLGQYPNANRRVVYKGVRVDVMEPIAY